LYASDSIVDVLGYTPDEVVGKKAWDFFHPSELNAVQEFHKRSQDMDKASVLAYCDIANRDQQWVRCECAFSIVYNVIVACTSIYRHGSESAASMFNSLVYYIR
jgi:PAS domain S-box-containing protein